MHGNISGAWESECVPSYIGVREQFADHGGQIDDFIDPNDGFNDDFYNDFEDFSDFIKDDYIDDFIGDDYHTDNPNYEEHYEDYYKTRIRELISLTKIIT